MRTAGVEGGGDDGRVLVSRAGPGVRRRKREIQARSWMRDGESWDR